MKYFLSLVALTSAVSSTDFTTNTKAMEWLEALTEIEHQIVINGMSHWSEDKTFTVTMPEVGAAAKMAVKISGTEWEDIDVAVSTDMPATNTFTTAVWPSALDSSPNTFKFEDAKLVTANGNVYSTYRGYELSAIAMDGDFAYVFTNK